LARFLGNLIALTLLLLLLVAGTGVLTSLISSVLPSESKSFTSAHFKSPSLPNILDSSKGVAKNFGKTASFVALFLLALFPLILVFLFKMIRSLNDGEKEDVQTMPPPTSLEIKNGNRYFLPTLFALFLLAIFMKTLYFTPVSKENSLMSKTLSGQKFYVLLNSAFIYKALFMEKDYTNLIFRALERDVNEYADFSEIEYWAVFGRGGVTKKVNRNMVASKRLYMMYKNGKLNDTSVFLAYQTSKRAGKMKNAKEMIEYLLKKYPRNKRYNNEYLDIIGRWS